MQASFSHLLPWHTLTLALPWADPTVSKLKGTWEVT